ncbi:MAG: hypothetical protein IKP64_07870 [Selenomonadaceae bacterium]|nr:hypothetical protein [Selenomonadaceae bacterium]
MLKKFFALTFALVLFAAQACAATFQSPVKIGSVGVGGRNGLSIEGATKIDGDFNGKVYMKGVALFGDKLYLHFDDAAASDFNAGSYFGSSDVKNSVQYYVFEGSTNISRLPNDTGVDMYLLTTETGGGNRTAVIGNRDGKWVKFFDTNSAKKTYGLRGYFTKNIRVTGDTIILELSSFDEKNSCELRYRWDSANKWFGVEKI